MEAKSTSERIAEFAEQASFVKAFDEIEEGYWGLECDAGEIAILINLEAETLTLQAILGTPDKADRAELYAKLLTITGQTHTDPKFRIAIVEPGGDVIQQLDLLIEDLNSTSIDETVSRFCHVAAQNRDLVQGINTIKEFGDTLDGPPGAIRA